MARAWGFWTRWKLEILANYLNAFTTAASHPSERIYLDLFAGEAENTDRDTGKPLRGSAQVALDVQDPPFTRLRFVELEHAPELRRELVLKMTGRDAQVLEGNCNDIIGDVLNELSPLQWAPTFAFLDPNGPDYSWYTLEALAGFKKGSRYKVELWILFPEPMFVRFLRVDGGAVRPEDRERISGMFGTEAWARIYEARLSGRLAPGEARDEYVNLMRWRIEADLGYQWTHTFEVRTDRDRPIYHMIFATDNKAGNDIMTHLYDQAAREFPKMRQEVVDRKKGYSEQKLFEDFHEDRPLYEHEPPLPPFGTPERGEVEQRST